MPSTVLIEECDLNQIWDQGKVEIRSHTMFYEVTIQLYIYVTIRCIR